MQPSENFSVPRRTLDLEDYIDIMRRHKGWILGPFLLTLVASVVGVYLWPDSYESVAVIKVVPQQIPQNMVPSSITQDMSDRITSMATTVLSRAVLTTIINTRELYKRELGRLPMDDVVENIMRKDVSINPILAGSNGRNVPAFTVKFTYQDRNMVHTVVQDLVSEFTKANASDRSNITIQTKDFMKEATEQAKKELDTLEATLAAFRAQNSGRLPDQVDENVRRLSVLQTNLQGLLSSKTRAELEKLTFETNLSVDQSRKTGLTREIPQAIAAASAKSERLQEIERDIRNLEDAITVNRQRMTDEHPDMKNAQSRLEAAKSRRQEILQEEAEAKKNGTAPTPAVNYQTQREVIDIDGNIKRWESAKIAKDLEVAQMESQIKQVQSQIDRLEAQINAAPLGQQKYSDILRERDLAKERYVNLDAKLSTAQIAQEVENRGQGEKLEVLDPASLPQTPTEPKRPMVIGIGAGLGLLFGFVIAAAREMKDTSLKNLKDVRAYTQIAILGSVPLLENDFVVRRRKRMAWLGWTTACLMAVVTMAGSVVYYYEKF